jgi:hypothetical protein
VLARQHWQLAQKSQAQAQAAEPVTDAAADSG